MATYLCIDRLGKVYYHTRISMTTLLQTRVSKELAARFKSAAKAKGKSSYQVLRELAQAFAQQEAVGRFASNGYSERFQLPMASEFKKELRSRILRRHEKHY